MKRTLLLDADIFAYQAAASNEKVMYFNGPDEEPSVEADLAGAIASADRRVDEVIEKLGATDVIICLTDRGNEFRKDFWPDYKGNRKGRKPTHLFDVLDHFAGKHKTYLRPRLEADDCMGILSTHPSLIDGERIIVSEDKDMQTIPGLLFNPRKDDKPRKIGKLAANRFHMAQTIIGDPTDNFPGAKGIGPKSPEVEAVMVAKTVEAMWGHVVLAYERALAKQIKSPSPVPPADLTAMAVASATVQARCARILRSCDWDFRSKKPILWTPPFHSK